MPTYDAFQFKPPAPLALETLRHPETSAKLTDVPLLIDSGADVTLLPAHRSSYGHPGTEHPQSFDALAGRPAIDVAGSAALICRFILALCFAAFFGVFSVWGYINAGFKSAQQEMHYKKLLMTSPKAAEEYRRQCIAEGDAARAASISHARREFEEERAQARKAIEPWTMAIERDPRDAAAYYARARLRHKVYGAEALTDYDKVIELQPTNAKAYVGRAALHWDSILPGSKGEKNLTRTREAWALALRELREAVRIDPDLAVAQACLAAALVQGVPETNDHAKALTHALRACELTRFQNPDFLEVLAHCHSLSGDFEAALRREKEALRIAEPLQSRRVYAMRMNIEGYTYRRTPVGFLVVTPIELVGRQLPNS